MKFGNALPAAAAEESRNPVHGSRADVPVFLQNLVLDSPDVEHFLTRLAQVAAVYLSERGREVLCGITLLRPRHAETLASSSEAALKLDEIQYSYGDGPCLTAARTLQLVYVRDTRTDQRWPEYFVAVAEHGMRSILGVPIPLEGEANCALNLYSSAADGFPPEAVRAAEAFARDASKSLRLAVRIAHLSDQAAHLTSALESRTVINLAAGIVMGQNRCSQTTAMNILIAASNSRNIKLRDIAANVVSIASDETPTTHFD
ncbi:ANTAR domain-containing protein [Arthrobacter cheniae]|uniref:ANTAR domain-containing protein n=1 Tax=Arthrobacter cheniae TaxID=1258888 RepID=A0A3A5M6G9_9MICC|nr:GAF and ANTAR domain-containing protein [Arthrobacter cheniae]RJT81797.1 ANTAR domain-containing protein [Arthrobacter cheniae]